MNRPTVRELAQGPADELSQLPAPCGSRSTDRRYRKLALAEVNQYDVFTQAQHPARLFILGTLQLFVHLDEIGGRRQPEPSLPLQ